MRNLRANRQETILNKWTFEEEVDFGLNKWGKDIKFYGATDGAYMLWDASANALVFVGSDITLGGDLAITGDVTLTGDITAAGDSLAITTTDPTGPTDGIQSTMDLGVAYTTGNCVAGRFYTKSSAPSGSVYDMTAVWAGLNWEAAFAASGRGLSCAINAEVVTSPAAAMGHPNAILYLQSVPLGASSSHATMPYIVFSETATGTGSNILFEVGHEPAGTTCTTGTGKLYYTNTLQIKVNGDARYIPLSTVENALTMSGAISTTLITDSSSTATGSIITSGGIGVAKSVHVGGSVAISGLPTTVDLGTLNLGNQTTRLVDTSLLDSLFFQSVVTACAKTSGGNSTCAGYFSANNTGATTNARLQSVLAHTYLSGACHDAYGVQGHATIVLDSVIANNGNVVGVSGKITVSSTKTVTGAVSAIMATLDGAGTVTGTHSGIWVDATVSCDNGILISSTGTCGSGINLTGTITEGINIASTSTDGILITGTCTNGIHMHPFDGYAMYIGEWDCYTDVADGWNLGQTGHGRSVCFTANDGGTDPTRTITAVHSRFCQTKDYSDTFSTTALIGEYYSPNGSNIVATSDNCNMSGVMGYMEIATGGDAKIGGSSGKLIYIAGLESWLELGADVDILATGKACGLKLSNNFKSGWALGTGHTYAIYAETVDTAGFEYVFGTNTMANGFVESCSVVPAVGVQPIAAMKVEIAGVEGFIQVFSGVDWANA